MPKAKNGDISIYYEMEGEGPPLVLAHGLTGSVEHWRRLGYIDALKKDFRLIAFDARGHGQSDKPHQSSDYGLRMTEDVVAILDDIGLSKAHYFGYSMGGRIGFRVATRYPDRFHSFTLGGVSPYRSEAEKKVETELVAEMKLLLDDPEAGLLHREKRTGHSLTSEEKDRLFANDLEALIAVAESYDEIPPLTEQDLSQISVPCLLFCGSLDPRYEGARECCKHLPHVKFISLPELDHGQAFSQIDSVIPHVKEFFATAG